MKNIFVAACLAAAACGGELDHQIAVATGQIVSAPGPTEPTEPIGVPADDRQCDQKRFPLFQGYQYPREGAWESGLRECNRICSTYWGCACNTASFDVYERDNDQMYYATGNISQAMKKVNNWTIRTGEAECDFGASIAACLAACNSQHEGNQAQYAVCTAACSDGIGPRREVF